MNELLILHHRNLASNSDICEYIENIGPSMSSDYIATDLIPSGLTWSKVEYKYMITNTVAQWVNLFGVRGQAGMSVYTPEFAVWKSSSNRLREDINSDGHPEGMALSVGTLLERTLDIANSGESNFTCAAPMYIFTCNNPGTPGLEYRGPSRFYYLRGYDYNNNLIFNLRPCNRGGVGYIKDTVTGKTYFPALNNGNIISSVSSANSLNLLGSDSEPLTSLVNGGGVRFKLRFNRWRIAA